MSFIIHASLISKAITEKLFLANKQALLRRALKMVIMARTKPLANEYRLKNFYYLLSIVPRNGRYAHGGIFSGHKILFVQKMMAFWLLLSSTKSNVVMQF